MAQKWATAFYKSPRWLKNRSNYMNAVVDTSGNVLVVRERDGRQFYARRGDPSATPVPDSCVIPPRMCERCFAMGELTPAKVVHHKAHLTPQNIDDPHYSLAYDNLMRLCQDCHAFAHSSRQEPRVTFDAEGNVVPRRESLAEAVLRLTETADEARNIHGRKR